MPRLANCNHKDNKKCANDRWQFSQAVDQKLLMLNIELRANTEQRRHRASEYPHRSLPAAG